MGAPRPLVFAYDISKDKTRRRVFKILKQWRIGGQKSVHECRLKKAQAEELFLQLNEKLDQTTDCLMLAWLETHRNVLHRGIGQDSINELQRHIEAS